MVNQEPEVQLDHEELLVHRVIPDNAVMPDHQETMENQEHQVHQDLQDFQEKLDHKDHQE